MAPKQRQGYGGYGSNAVKAEATPAPEFSAKFAPAVEHFPIKEAAAPPPVAVGTTDSTKPDQASSHTNEELIFSAAFAPAVAHFPIKEAAAPPPVAIGTTDTTKPDRASSDANEQLIASLVRWNKLQAASKEADARTIAAQELHEAEKHRQQDVSSTNVSEGSNTPGSSRSSNFSSPGSSSQRLAENEELQRRLDGFANTQEKSRLEMSSCKSRPSSCDKIMCESKVNSGIYQEILREQDIRASSRR